MVITVPVKGYFEENTYFWIDEGSEHGFLIDPGAEGERLVRMIRLNGWTIEKILLTHGHVDHIGAVDTVRKEFPVPVLASHRSDDYLKNKIWNLSTFCGTPLTVEGVEFVRDGDSFAPDAAPDAVFRVIETPGHTTDSVVYWCERDGLCFTGDTIFRGTIGNDRFPGGDRRTMLKSICEKILTLPEETVLWSGHTEETTVREERPHFGPWGGWMKP